MNDQIKRPMLAETLDRPERLDWRDGLTGQIANYQHFARGAKEKPRFPSFREFRDRDDF